MAEISQRTIASMIVLFKHLGCFDPILIMSWDDGPAVTTTQLRNFLYARDFDRQLLDRFEFMRWDFADILPALRDNSIWGRKRVAHPAALENQSHNEELLRKLAEVLPLLHDWSDDINREAFEEFESNLQRDGLTFCAGIVIDADTEIVDIPAGAH